MFFLFALLRNRWWCGGGNDLLSCACSLRKAKEARFPFEFSLHFPAFSAWRMSGRCSRIKMVKSLGGWGRWRRKRMMETLTDGRWSGWDIIYGTDAFRINFRFAIEARESQTPVYMRQALSTRHGETEARKIDKKNFFARSRKGRWSRSNDFLMSVSLSDSPWVIIQISIFLSEQNAARCAENRFSPTWLIVIAEL